MWMGEERCVDGREMMRGLMDDREVCSVTEKSQKYWGSDELLCQCLMNYSEVMILATTRSYGRVCYCGHCGSKFWHECSHGGVEIG